MSQDHAVGRRAVRLFAITIAVTASILWAGSLAAPSGVVLAAQKSVILPSPTVTAQATPPVNYLPASLAATTPVYAQGDFLGGYGCAPTSVSMVLGYFHAVNPADQMAGKEALVGPGDFVAGEGVPYNAMLDTLATLGYTHISGHENATFAELQADLADGPVIVTAGVHLTASGPTPGTVNHSLVVVGITGDNAHVLVNDPWSGRQVSLSTASFETMWQAGHNGIVVIRP